MNCQRVIPVLSAYQDGEIDPALGREVELHLRECPSCRDEWDALQVLLQRLRLAQPPVDDPFFPARVMDQLRARPARKTGLLQAAAFALVFITIFLTGFLLQTSLGSRASAEPLPAATFSAVLLEPQGLGLMAVHEDTLNLFNGSNHGRE
jgi:predicted anti-sigma-YlaC factor YlaD